MADNGYFGVDLAVDPQGRSGHCWVNCMSTRIHAGNPLPVLAAGISKEVIDLIRFPEHYDDSIQDMNANIRGQQMAFVFWRWCDSLCKDCQGCSSSNDMFSYCHFPWDSGVQLRVLRFDGPPIGRRP